MKKVFVISLVELILFNLNETILFSYTLWDQIMEEQSHLMLKRGILFFSQKNYKKAAEEFLKSIQNKETSIAYTLYGASLYWMGDNEGALENYQKAIEMDKNNDMAWQLKGISHARNGELEIALENFIQSYKLNPNKSDVLMNIASVYFSVGKLAEAIEYIKKAILIDPKNPLYFYQLGLMKLYEEELFEAQKNFQRAIEIRPNYQEAILWNGIVLEALGNEKEAIRSYQKAISLKPLDFFARYKLARIKLKKNILLKDQIIEIFQLQLPSENSLPLFLTYSKKNNKPSNQIYQIIDDMINNLSDGDEVIITVDGLIEKTDFTLERKGSNYEKKHLQKALLEKFKRDVKTISKTFTLLINKKDLEFKKEIEAIKLEIENLSKQATRINISSDVKKRSKKGSNDTDAVYLPRNVGNDMGLWLIGNPWIYVVEEELRNLTENLTAKEKVIYGAGHLIIGDIEKAKKMFLEIKNEFPDISFLAIGVCEYLEGNKKEAIEYFKKASNFEKSKKIANINLRYLDGNK